MRPNFASQQSKGQAPSASGSGCPGPPGGTWRLESGTTTEQGLAVAADGRRSAVAAAASRQAVPHCIRLTIADLHFPPSFSRALKGEPEREEMVER